MAKFIQGVSADEVFDAVMSCGIEDSPENQLYIEQALEVFLGREFDSSEFINELLALADWTAYEQGYILGCILSAVEEFEGQAVYSADTRLVAMVQEAKERAARAVEREKCASKDNDDGMEIG